MLVVRMQMVVELFYSRLYQCGGDYAMRESSLFKETIHVDRSERIGPQNITAISQGSKGRVFPGVGEIGVTPTRTLNDCHDLSRRRLVGQEVEKPCSPDDRDNGKQTPIDHDSYRRYLWESRSRPRNALTRFS